MVLKTSFGFSLSFLFSLLLFQPIFAQPRSVTIGQDRTSSATDLNQTIPEKSPEPLKGITPDIAALPHAPQQTLVPSAKRSITISEAVSIFLRQNLQLVAARYDINTVDAEKLTDANSELARAEFQIVVWQLTNDVKKKFYAVLLADSLLRLAQENQKTFAEIIKHTTEVFQLGEISGLDLQRLEIEKFKFDTDVANSERDYELALRDLRVTLGGDYRVTDVEVAGTIDYYQPYDFSLADLREKALAARPDLKAAQLSERAADASIRLQDARRIPDLTVGAGIDQVPASGNTYNFGVGIEFSLKAGESSTLELLDAIRTRRETLAGFYQTLFDYQVSLLDLELATATPLQK